MIEPKEIVIDERNDYEELRWALFTPYLPSIKDRNIDTEAVDEAVRKITYATEVILLLSDFRVPSRIREELRWVSKYADITVVARSEEILKRFGDMRFRAVTDPEIRFDYISITDRFGGKTRYFLDGLLPADEDMEDVYLKKGDRVGGGFSLPDGTDCVFIAGRGNAHDGAAYAYCRKKGITVCYVAEVARFDRKLYDVLERNGLGIVAAEGANEGIYALKGDGLYKIIDVNGQAVRIRAPGADSLFTGAAYLNIGTDGTVDPFARECFLISDGKARHMSVKDVKVVDLPRRCASMRDFVEERFDSGETLNHSEYAAEARTVRYVYKLYPPYFDEDTFAVSSVYDGLKGLCEKIVAMCDEAGPDAVRDETESFNGNEGLLAILGDIDVAESFVKDLLRLRLSGYRRDLIGVTDQLKKDSDGLYGAFAAMCGEIMSEDFSEKVKKIDDEVENNERVIAQCEERIESGTDVIANRRRAESKKNENEVLLRQKNGFVEKNGKKQKKDADEFMSAHIGGKKGYPANPGDSLRRMVNGGAKETRLDMFGEFLNRRYDAVKGLLDELLRQFAAIGEIDLPEDYTVYDHDGGRYIVISEIDEFGATRKICERYSLQCVTRG